MKRRPPRSTRTDTLFPYTTLFRSVLFVFREDYYVGAKEPKRPTEGDEAKIFEDHARWATDMERVFGLAELIVAKQRHGATGKVTLKFEPEVTRFSDLAVSDYRNSASY